MNFRILLDMDGILCDHTTEWLRIYNSEYNDTLTKEDIKNWGWHNLVKPECGLKLYDILDRPGFFQSLKPLPNAIEVSKRLQDAGHELIIVTSPPRTSPTGLWDKYQWLQEYMPFLHKNALIGTHRKDLIAGSVLFDDGPHNIEAYPGRTCIMDKLYNQGVEANFRVSNWLEFEQVIIERELNE